MSHRHAVLKQLVPISGYVSVWWFSDGAGGGGGLSREPIPLVGLYEVTEHAGADCGGLGACQADIIDTYGEARPMHLIDDLFDALEYQRNMLEVLPEAEAHLDERLLRVHAKRIESLRQRSGPTP